MNNKWTLLVSFSLRAFLFSPIVLHTAYGEVSYSVPEEMKRGFVIGNIAKDLGLDVNTLSFRKARIDTEGNRKRYCDINLNTGELIVAERIDREGLCGKKALCVIKQELVLENHLESHRININVQDVNDNTPVFKKDIIKFEITESAVKGARFLLEEAHDADIGTNSVQTYNLGQNTYFELAVAAKATGKMYGELVLNKELDREQQQEVTLILTAVDGGTPPRSGTVAIHVSVLDANDNAPVFSQTVYKVSLPENSPLDTVVVTVSATDADEGQNGEVTYEFGHISESDMMVFSLDPSNGRITLIGSLDYEDESSFELPIQATDGLGMVSHATVVIEISDINDNSPSILIKSLNSPIPENALPGTEVGIINVQTFIIIILAVRFCRRRKPRLLFDGAVAIPSAYLPPNYAEVEGAGTLRSTYNYDAYLTTGSRTSDFKFVRSYNEGTLTADLTLKKTQSADDLNDFAEGIENVSQYLV
ncbi:protocadherin beta-16-like [Sinocyclocheilus grahami]|uniref:protocadherin beta-16-like n=1 Tax=Sinocyclocheilus grahami TaxID=75366 RepID=UPI0007AD5808|nr:PREDICTED: protocadherin beta-16-like [Sinocyclocheilus grahami]